MDTGLTEKYLHGVDRLADDIADFLLRNRLTLLIVFLMLTAMFGYFASTIKLDPGFEKSIPNDHPYMAVYQEYADQFGSGNSLVMALMQNEGDIFNPEFFKALDELTDRVNAIDGVDQTTTLSLFSPTAIIFNVDEDGFTGFRIVRADFEPTPEGIAEVRENLLKSSEIGRLVSLDFRGALVITELAERGSENGGRGLDYRALGKTLEELRSRYSDDRTTLHIIGFGKFISDVMDGIEAVLMFFVLAFFITAALLYLYTNSWPLTGLSLAIAVMAVVWELGVVELLGFGIDPFSVLVPFLVFSIGVSHAVQMANAWRIAIGEGESPTQAAKTAFRKVFIPGTTALISTAVGFAVIIVIDIPIIQELAITASIGMAVMIITNKFLFPLLLSYVPMSVKASQRTEARARALAENGIWLALARLTGRRAANIAIILAVGVLGYGIYVRGDLVVGDTGFGAPELRDDSRYNQDVRVIQKNFRFNTDELIVVAETGASGCVDFRVVYEIDRFHSFMENHPFASNVDSLADEVRLRNAGNGEGHFAFFEIPRSPFSISAALSRVELGQRLFNSGCSAMPIRIFAVNHDARTLASLLSSAEMYKENYPEMPIDLRLVSGSGGVMAATNEAVEDARTEMLVMLYIAVTALCFLTFVSWRVVFCIVAPLILVSQFAEAVMVWLDIGLKVSTLPVLALGAGVGVDYGIYLFSRTQAARREGMTLAEAHLMALRSAGTAVAFTSITLTIGVATWMFSPLKFQADMGLLLAYMFFVNMLGAFLVLPALASWMIPNGRTLPQVAE